MSQTQHKEIIEYVKSIERRVSRIETLLISVLITSTSSLFAIVIDVFLRST